MVQYLITFSNEVDCRNTTKYHTKNAWDPRINCIFKGGATLFWHGINSCIISYQNVTATLNYAGMINHRCSWLVNHWHVSNKLSGVPLIKYDITEMTLSPNLKAEKWKTVLAICKLIELGKLIKLGDGQVDQVGWWASWLSWVMGKLIKLVDGLVDQVEWWESWSS